MKTHRKAWVKETLGTRWTKCKTNTFLWTTCKMLSKYMHVYCLGDFTHYHSAL